MLLLWWEEITKMLKFILLMENVNTIWPQFQMVHLNQFLHTLMTGFWHAGEEEIKTVIFTIPAMIVGQFIQLHLLLILNNLEKSMMAKSLSPMIQIRKFLILPQKPGTLGQHLYIKLEVVLVLLHGRTFLSCLVGFPTGVEFKPLIIPLMPGKNWIQAQFQ